MAKATRTVICPSCGGTGCEDCERTGVVELEGTDNPRADGLPWHPHAVEGPTNIVAPRDVRRRRAPAVEDPAAMAERIRQLEAENDRLAARAHENAAPHVDGNADTARLGPPSTLLGG